MGHLSIIIPVLDEEPGIAQALTALSAYRQAGAEIIVADGGSRDDTPALARPLADRIVTSPRGRATQMNGGAAAATGDMLLFLHADTRLPRLADQLVFRALAVPHAWGRFDVSIESAHPLLPVIATAMNLRSRATGIATGDQAMFMTREAFAAVGGFPDIPLMEDIAISKRLKRLGWPVCLRERVTTSGRRWEAHGVSRTMLLMWRLRLAFFLGASPATLARQYGYVPRES